MPISLEEIRRMADDDARTRGIMGYLYCEKCAYCLRTLPRVGVCPECGNFYDSRIRSMRGIFTGREYSLPLGHAFGALVLISFTIYSVRAFLQSFDYGALVAATACGFVGLWYAYQTYRGFWTFFVAWSTVRAVERAREQEE